MLNVIKNCHSLILVNNQLDAQFFFLIYLFQFSTCFGQPRAHHQENQLYQYDIWYMSLSVGGRLICRSGRNSDIKNCHSSFVVSTTVTWILLHITTTVCKGKAAPLQAWSGPEGSRKLRFPDYMTTAQDGGKVVSLTHLPPLPPGNAPGTHFC
jgi:hypothetical protein